MTPRVALVTGGAGGMGRAIRARLESVGDIVVAADLHASDIVADATRVGDCERMVTETAAVYRRLCNSKSLKSEVGSLKSEV